MRRSMSLKKLLLSTVAGAAMLSVTAFAADADANFDPQRSVVETASVDQATADQVMEAIRRYSFFDIFDWVTVDVEDGVVTLRGDVREPLHGNDYAKIVARVPGVESVVNELSVLPFSNFDDVIRQDAAQAIYGNNVLQPLMRQPRPGIHVIVRNGKVRLEGVVRTTLDRELAGMVVRGNTPAFEVLNNLRVETT